MQSARARLALCLALGSAFSATCASTLPAYPGPRRPAQSVARLHAKDIDIEEVDGYRGGMTTGDFEIAPGIHSALVRIVARRDRAEFGSEPSRVCFVAEAGHTYAVVPRVVATGIGQGVWVPRIADETVNGWVQSSSHRAENATCPSQPMGPVFRIAWPVGQGDIRSDTMRQRAEYFRQVKARVEAHWHPVEAYAHKGPADPDLGMRTWATVLHVQVRADGSLMGVRIVVPSGSPLLDEIAVSAVRQAEPFPAPSPDLLRRTSMTTLPLAFEIKGAGTSAKAEP
jgi:TonB family protein